MFRNLFARKRRNTQPEAARLAHRAVTLARLAEQYHVQLSSAGAATLVQRLEGVPDAELAGFAAGAPSVVGCPHGITALFAGYAQSCARCPYNVRAPSKEESNHCALLPE